jgi:hypothetical protein
MKNAFKLLVTAALSLSLWGVSSLSANEGNAGNEGDSAEVLKKEAELSVSKVARVAGINHTTRKVILEDELGRQETVALSEDIERINEIEAGDLIEIDYFASVAAEVREPTEAELAAPLIIEESGGRNTMDYPPAGGKMRTLKAVCTVEGLDRPSETLTLRGPEGGLNVVRVQDVENLTKLRIGDTIIVTYQEALAMRIEKVAEEGTEEP